MPQFDLVFLNSQLFWLVLIFFVLYLIVSKIIAPKAEYIISSRDHYLDENIRYAKEYNEKTRSIREYRDTKLAEIILESANIERKSIKNIEDRFAQQKAELQDLLNKKELNAQKNIQKYVEDFRKSKADSSINLAAFIIEKITNKHANSSLLQKIQGTIK